MPNIDERVVQMKFDNKQFESGVSESLKTLEDLKKALNFDEVEGSLKNIENAFNNLDLSGLADSVDFIASRFEPLGKIADVALSRIADKAVDIGRKVTDAFFGFSDMSAGQDKYATYTKAVQTITNATGKSVAEVEKVLEELQHYTDETSYDFAEMVSSIGKFTSTGVDLNTAEEAMEGIANWAAKSGAGIQEANRAMYNLSQSISTGSVKLIDWKSIENANMATKEFKETAIQTAIELGVLQDKGNGIGSIVTTNEEKLNKANKALEKAKAATKDRDAKMAAAQEQVAKATKESTVSFKNFNETLSDGWLTTDVLLATLKKYSNVADPFGRSAYEAAQKALTFSDAIQAVKDAVTSGWMTSFKYIFGNLDEAMKLWTDVSNALYEYVALFADWRNEVLKGWHEMGGYNDMIEAATNLWETFMNIVKGVGEALTNVFPILKADNMTQALVDGTKKLKDWSAGLLEMFGLYQEVEEEEEETAEKAGEIADKTNEITENTNEAVKAVSDLGEETKKVASNLGSVETGLKRGMRGDNVKKLQKELIKYGFRLDKYGADGIFGPETQAALKALQREIGVAETGIMDEATKAALKTDEALQKLREHASKGISIGARGEDIKKLQKNLNKYLGESDQLIVDGIFGPKTEAAIKKLQKELGIAQTGVFDQATRNAIKTKKILLMSVKDLNKELKEGMKGADVKKLQQELIKGGYLDKGMADGIYGPKTREAVKKLQKALGIRDTGEWDKATQIAVHNAQEMTQAANTSTKANKKISENTKKAASENKKTSEEAEKVISKTTLAMKKLQAITRGFAAGIKIITKFAGSIVQVARNIAGMFAPLVGDVRDFVYFISGMIENLSKQLDEDNAYKKFVDNVTNAFEPLKIFLDRVHTVFHDFLKGYEIFLKKIDSKHPGKHNTFTNFLKYIEENYPVLNGILDTFKTIGKIIGSVIDFVSGIISSFFKMLSSEEFQNTKSNVFSWISDRITQFKETIEKFRKDHPELTIENFFNKLKEVGGWLGGKFGSGITIIKDKFVEFKAVINKLIEDHPELSISNIFEKIKGTFKSISDMFSKFFANDQQSETGTFFDSLKERFKAFEPVLDWMEGIKDRIVKLWQSIFGGGETEKAASTIKATNPSTTPMVKTMEVVEEKLSIFDRVVNWFIELKDKFIAAWNDLIGVSKGEGIEPPKEGGFVSVADKLKDFGKWILDNWPAISLAVIGVGASYALVSAIQIARNLGKGFKDLGGALKNLFGKDEEKDTIGTTALKIAGAIAIVALAIGLLSVIDANKAWNGIVPFIAVLGLMSAAVIAINKLGGENDDGAKQALMLAGSIGIIALAIWLMCATIKKYAEGGVIVGAVLIIALMIGALATIAIYLTKQPGSGVELKGFLAMCAGVLVLVIAFRQMMKTLVKYIDKPGTVVAAFLIIEAMFVTLGGIAVLTAKYSSNESGDVVFKGFASMCAGVMILVYAFEKLMKILISNIGEPGTVIAAFLIIEVMLVTLGGIAILTAKYSRGGEAGMRGFLSMCAGVYVLALAFEKVLNVIGSGEYSKGQIFASFLIIEAMVATLGIVSLLLSKSSNRGTVKVVGLLALVGALWVVSEVFGRVVSIIAQNNPGVVAAALIAITAMLGALIYVANTMGKGSGSFIGAIGNAITFVTLAYAMDKIVRAIGDVIYKVKDANPEILKWFFIGIDGAIAIMATTVAVLGKLFATNPIGLIIGEAGLLALFGVLAAGIGILAKVADSALQRFSSTIKYLGWGLESFDTSTGGIDLERLKKVGEFLKDNLPEMVKSVLGITTTGLKKKMSAIQDMGNKIQLFAVAVSAVDQKALNGASNSKTLMEKADEIADTLNDASLPDLGKLGSLYMFGTSLYAYGYALSEMKAGDDTTVGKLISQTTNLLGIVTNKQKLDQATSSIQALGGALGIYFKALDTREIGENGQAVENTPIDIQAMAQKMRELVGAFTDEEIGELTSYGEGKQHDMSAVANGISQLSLAFGSYADNIGKLEKDDIERANGVIDKIQGMTYDQSKINEFSDGFSGINVPGAFVVALQIFGLGLALSSYAENIGKLNATQVKNANDVLDEFIKIYEMKDRLTRPANILDLLWKAFHSDTDEFDLTQFAADVAGVGNALKVYGDGIVGLNIGKVFLANRVLNSLLNVANELTQDTWWSQLLFGNKSFGDFATNVSDLGGGLKDFGDAISKATFDTSKIEAVFKDGGVIDQLLSLLKKTDVADLYMTDFTSNMTVFKSGPIATAIKTFFDNLALVFSDEETNNGAVSALGSAGQSIIDAIATGITNGNTDNLQSSVFSAINTSISNASISMVSVMNTLGTDMLSWIGTGLKDENAVSQITGTIEALIGKIKTVFTNSWSAFKGMGMFIDLGIVTGMKEHQSLVTQTAEDVVWEAYLAAMNKIGVESPSKEYEWLGEMSDEGYAKGLTDNADVINDAAADVQEQAMQAFNESQNGNEKKSFWSEFAEGAKDAFTAIGTGISNAAHATGQAIKTGAEFVADGFANVFFKPFNKKVDETVSNPAIINGKIGEMFAASLSVSEETRNKMGQFGNDLVGSMIPGIATASAEELPKAMSEAVSNGIPTDTEGMEVVGETIVSSISSGTENSKSVTTISQAIEKIIGGIKTFVTSKWDLFKGIGQFINMGITTGLDTYKSIVTQKAEEVAWAAYLAAKNRLGIASPSKEFMWIGEMADEGLAKGLTDNVGIITNAASNAQDQVTEVFDNMQSHNEDKRFWSEFLDGAKYTLNSIGEGVSNAVQSTGQAIGTFVDNAGQYISNGFETVKATAGTMGELFKSGEVINAMFGDKETVKNAAARYFGVTQNSVQTAVEGALKVGKDSSTDFTDIGKKMLLNVAVGLSDEEKRKKIGNDMNAVLAYVSKVVKNEKNKEEFSSIGKYMDAGLEHGLAIGSNGVTAMAERVAWAAYLAAKRRLGIASPSKEFIWIGEMLDEGLVKGLNSYGHTVSNAAANVADGAVDAAIKGALALNDVFEFDGDYQPVIRPVLDLSDVKANASSINDMLSPRSITPIRSTALASSITVTQRSRQATEVQSTGDGSYKLLGQAFDKFDEKMQDVSEAIKNMKIYMDGTTLVGYVSPRVNKTLGQQATLAGRMN